MVISSSEFKPAVRLTTSRMINSAISILHSHYEGVICQRPRPNVTIIATPDRRDVLLARMS